MVFHPQPKNIRSWLHYLSLAATLKWWWMEITLRYLSYVAIYGTTNKFRRKSISPPNAKKTIERNYRNCLEVQNDLIIWSRQWLVKLSPLDVSCMYEHGRSIRSQSRIKEFSLWRNNLQYLVCFKVAVICWLHLSVPHLDPIRRTQCIAMDCTETKYDANYCSISVYSTIFVLATSCFVENCTSFSILIPFYSFSMMPEV